mmetsp:Transcript_142916/g.398203  ORF Transcript_142916/g.398203 Transcript_142916/m.398203 type:complete len:211 (+) Transcript_142916:2427-3059(+)
MHRSQSGPAPVPPSGPPPGKHSRGRAAHRLPNRRLREFCHSLMRAQWPSPSAPHHVLSRRRLALAAIARGTPGSWPWLCLGCLWAPPCPGEALRFVGFGTHHGCPSCTETAPSVPSSAPASHPNCCLASRRICSAPRTGELLPHHCVCAGGFRGSAGRPHPPTHQAPAGRGTPPRRTDLPSLAGGGGGPAGRLRPPQAHRHPSWARCSHR